MVIIHKTLLILEELPDQIRYFLLHNNINEVTLKEYEQLHGFYL